MRIVHVIGSVSLRLGGPSKAVLEMSGALTARGHEVHVVTTSLVDRGSWAPVPRSGDLQLVQTGRRLAPDGYYVTYCRPTWPTRWATSLEMLHVLQTMVPTADVVHIHSMYLFPTLVASRLARAHRVPYVLRPHGTLDPYIRRRHRLFKAFYSAVVEDATLKQAAAIHFTSERERDLAKPALPPGARTCVVPLGVDVVDYATLPERSSARLSFGLPDEAVVCLFLGRLNHKKGLDILAPAFVRLCAEVPGVWLLLAGPDDDGLGERFAGVCSEAGVGERVIRPGFLEPARVKLALAAADLWVLPSYSENFGLAVVEAMASGLPVVITNQVNIWPLVNSAGAGVVTAPDVNSFFAGMADVACQPLVRRKAMGHRGRSLCEREFAWAPISRQLERLYDTVRGWAAAGVTCEVPD